MHRAFLFISLFLPGVLLARSPMDEPADSLPFTSLPYILPLELKLGEYYLRPQALPANEPARSGGVRLQTNDLTFQFYTQQSRDGLSHPGWIASLQPNSRQTSFMSLTWQRRDSFFTVDFRQDFSSGPQISGSDLLVGTGLAYGRTIYSSVALLFGMKTAGTLDPMRSSMGQVVVDYGKVFFTPGLQLRNRSVTFETFLEMPVYAYDLRSHMVETTNPRDVRANIGIRYNR